MQFKEFLVEGTERPSGQPHFWTSILSGRKQDVLSHLQVLKDVYRTAAGGRGENPLPPISVKWDGSMNLHLSHDGQVSYKMGKPIVNQMDLVTRKFGEKSQGIIKSILAVHGAKPLALNGATLHTDIIRSGEGFARAATREIKPNSITYRVDPTEERQHIVAVHGITSEGKFLSPTAEHLAKYADLKHPQIAIVSAHIDPTATPSSPTKFPFQQATRRVDDAIHAINSIADEDLAAFTEHQKYKMGNGKGSFLRDWLHSQVYNKTPPHIDSYIAHVRDHMTANKGGRDEVIAHAEANKGPIERVTRALQQVTPASDFAGQAAHYLNTPQAAYPADLDHEGLVYEHNGKTWKAVPTSFTRQVLTR